jgi:hypothetical protein
MSIPDTLKKTRQPCLLKPLFYRMNRIMTDEKLPPLFRPWVTALDSLPPPSRGVAPAEENSEEFPDQL